MNSTIIIRHPKENLKKCSLRGLEHRKDIIFLTYPIKPPLPLLENYIQLALGGPLLSPADASSGLLILDGTWRYAEKMGLAFSHLPKRSLPPLATAYPRRQEDCPEKDRGLASVEALYAAYALLGRDTTGLLDHYYWKELFLRANVDAFC